MTCVAAVAFDGAVWMGADACSSTEKDEARYVAMNPKIYKKGEFIFGCAGSWRLIDLMGYRFEPPRIHPDDDIDRYMRVDFIDALRECFSEAGLTETENGVESFEGSFLVGYKDRIFEVQNDFSVLSCPDWGYAIGSGEEVAMGSLFTTKNFQFKRRNAKPQKRVQAALEAAAEIIAAVRGPFTILTTHVEADHGEDDLDDDNGLP